MSWRTPSVVLVSLFVIGALQAQDKPDILKNAEQLQKIELERVEAEFKDANAEADKVKRENPAKAIAILRTLRDNIEANTNLPEKNRAAMLTTLNFRLDGLTKRVSESTPIPNTTATIRAQEEKRKADEAEILKRQFAEVESLRRAGRTAEANALAAKIGMENAGKPGAQALGTQQRVAIAKANDEYLKKTRSEGFVAVLEDEGIAKLPSNGVQSFPRDWAEKSQKRSQLNITEAERKLIKALSTPIDIDLKDSSLEAVIGYLQDKTGVTIIVPNTILDEKGITYKIPVTASYKQVTMRTILKKTLADVGLTYIIQKETIQVTTEERAKLTLSTRTYYMGDLIGLTGGRFGRNQLQMMTTINDIIGVITGTIEPQSWWINGGPGTIAFNPGTMSLVVRQTAEIHYMLGIGKR